jgi:hypothetical protein
MAVMQGGVQTIQLMSPRTERVVDRNKSVMYRLTSLMTMGSCCWPRETGGHTQLAMPQVKDACFQVPVFQSTALLTCVDAEALVVNRNLVPLPRRARRPEYEPCEVDNPVLACNQPVDV